MARKGPIRVPQFDPDEPEPMPDLGVTEVMLPAAAIIDAGVEKFLELAKLYWPAKDGFKLTSFDMRNDRQLRMALGLVYMAMLEVSDAARCSTTASDL